MVDATAVFCATMLTKLPFTTHIVCHISTLTKIIINKNIRHWRSSVCLSLNSLYYRKEYLKMIFCWLSSSVQIECHLCKKFKFEKSVCIRLCHSIIISSNINEVWTCPLVACRNDVGYWSNEAFKCYCGSFFIHSKLSPFWWCRRTAKARSE